MLPSDSETVAQSVNISYSTHLASEGVTTDLGGVLYLINLMQRLDLPACFEHDWQLQSQVSPWALLELIARSLLLQLDRDFSEDALWQVLAQLDGRAQGAPIGGRFVGPDSYQIPLRWLQVVSDQYEISYASKANRLRVWSSVDFLIKSS